MRHERLGRIVLLLASLSMGGTVLAQGGPGGGMGRGMMGYAGPMGPGMMGGVGAQIPDAVLDPS